MDIQEFVPVDFYNNENTALKDNLSKGQTFETFDEVVKYLTQYCEQKRFEYWKRRVEYDNNDIVHKCTYECTKAAQYHPRKNEDPEKHCQRSSGSIGKDV